MKRKDFLENVLSEEKNVSKTVSATLEADSKFLKRHKRKLEDEIEDAQEALKKRLSENVEIDKSVVENLYADIVNKTALLKMYEDFEIAYISA